MTTISLYREKTTFYKVSTSSLRRLDDETTYLRSNRVILEVKPIRERLVVRANSVFNTLRCAIMILNEYAKNPDCLHKGADVDWEYLWWGQVSRYDSDWNPDTWASIHVDGRLAFASRESELIDRIESAAKGLDLTEEMVRRAIRVFAKPGEDLFVDHESQTAVLFSFFPTSVRGTVLERQKDRTKSFSATMAYKEGLLSLFSSRLKFIADLVEAMALRDMLEGTITGIFDSAPAEQLDAARERRAECLQAITDFENSTNVVYRPERPLLF